MLSGGPVVGRHWMKLKWTKWRHNGSASFVVLDTEFIELIRVKFGICYQHQSKGKGKGVPLQAWSGPEGSRKLRFPDFMTTAQDGGKVVSLTRRPPLPPGNTPGTHFC